MRFNRLDLNLLVALDALLTERSVTRAAARLNLSASATSDALGRLRDYFGDELLVQVGRRMEPTPRAESLQHAVRDVLVRVDSAIATPPRFDPATSDRVFRIYVSDYSQLVLGPTLMPRVARAGCTARMEFMPQVSDPQRDLEHGHADLLIVPHPLLSTQHPHEILFEDSFVCVLDAGSPLAEGPLTRERYEQASHVVMRPTADSADSYQDGFIKRMGVERRVAASSYGFATLPALLAGTPYVATLHARLARMLCRAWPLVMRPCPLQIPTMRQALQWHAYRTLDPGLVWLRDTLRAAASELPPIAA